MVIRRASIDEAATLAAFASRAFAETFAAHNTPEDMATYLAKSYGDAQQRAELADSGIVTLICEVRFSGRRHAGLRARERSSDRSGHDTRAR
jgi:hypothetical protein